MEGFVTQRGALLVIIIRIAVAAVSTVLAISFLGFAGYSAGIWLNVLSRSPERPTATFGALADNTLQNALDNVNPAYANGESCIRTSTAGAASAKNLDYMKYLATVALIGLPSSVIALSRCRRKNPPVFRRGESNQNRREAYLRQPSELGKHRYSNSDRMVNSRADQVQSRSIQHAWRRMGGLYSASTNAQ
jgi:hypothetical protein